ncbi:MAG: hypothetical protein KDG89_16065 [Geminicoccaceae bacterium]|nr:hypothetical protein [Geminicoccaceae bacterium]
MREGSSIFGRIIALCIAVGIGFALFAAFEAPLPETPYFVPTGDYEGKADQPPSPEAVDETIGRARTQQF